MIQGNQFNRSVKLVSDRAKRFFQPPEFKRVLRLAAWKAGMVFVDKWLPMRWDPQYARRIGYSGRGGRDTIPYYERGVWIFNAQRAAPRASVNASGLKLRIPVPIGHAITAKTAKDFTKITEQEAADVANAFLTYAMEIVRGTSSANKTVGKQAVTVKSGKYKGMLKMKGVKRQVRQLNLQDRAMAKAITAKGGFRGGRVATELQARAATLRQDRKLLVKKKLNQWQLKKRHQQWSRTAGGAAGPTGSQILSGQTMSKTYAGSRLQRHAQAQQRYRAKYRSGQRAIDAGTAGANAFISNTI